MEHFNFWMKAGALGLAAAPLFFAAQSGQSKQLMPSWARWRFEVTGKQNRAHALWTVIIGGDDQNGCPVVLHEEPFDLPCKAVGDAGVQGSTLIFKGGYFECEFPDLLEEANKIIVPRWGKECLLAGTGEGMCSPMKFAYAKAELQPHEEGALPIFRHPSIRFSLIAQGGDVQNHFHFGGQESTGRPESVKQGNFESRFVRTAKSCADPNAAYHFEHYINGHAVGQEKRDYQPQLHTGKTTVYIGGEPKGKQPFLGMLERLEVDPGCRAH